MKNHTAIILAAGTGNRLGDITKNKPKPLIEVSGKSLIEHSIDFAKSLGIRDVFVVGGYHYDKLKEKVNSIDSSIEVINNTEYTDQNLLSFAKALHMVGENSIFVYDTDHIFKDDTLRATAKNMKNISIYCSYDLSGDKEDVMKVKVDSNGNMIEMSKDLKSFECIYTGMFFIDSKYLSVVRSCISSAFDKYSKKNARVESIFEEFKKKGYSINVVDIGKSDWVEIDTPEDLEKAKKEFDNNQDGVIKIIKCTLCDSDKIKDFYQGIDKYYSGEFVSCSVCENCNLVFLNPRMSEKGYKEMYKSIFQNKRRNIDTIEVAITRLKNKKSYEVKEKIYPKYFEGLIKKDGKCLEIGAGWGTLAKVVQDKFGCNVEIIEPSSLSAKTAKEFYGLNVYNVDFDGFMESESCNKKYDLIFGFHSFEHVLNPDEFLEKVKLILKPAGSLLLALPDLSRPEESLEKFFHIEHSYYYTPKTLDLIMTKHNFRRIKFWKDKTDMKVVYMYDGNTQIKNFHNNELIKIKTQIKIMDLRYKILRFFKKVIYIFLNSRQKDKVSRVASHFLKKLRIIKV